MKNTRIYVAAISLLLVCAMAINLTGCATQVQAANLMEGITAKEVSGLDDLTSQSADVTDFAVRLFKAGNENDKNTLISPLSVLYALAMTANGAKGDTRAQMEDVLGMNVEELNLYLYSYSKTLTQNETCKLKPANSIWFTDDAGFTAKRNFLQTNADYYGAEIRKAPFDDSTCKDINNWVKDKTDGMIPEILDSIPNDAVMYLVNALAFEAEWDEMYEDNRIHEDEFTKEDGSKQTAEFMYSTEGAYLEDEKATGFIKYYKGKKYALAALLPNEGVSVSEYISSLDGKSLHALLSEPQYTTVKTAIPQFESEYSTELSKVLQSMGMTDAFNGNRANFSGLGSSTDGNIFISRVLHKTFISVDPKGTKAAAATVVEMRDLADDITIDSKYVYLDRPFVYMLIDCETNIPFFIGTMMDIGK